MRDRVCVMSTEPTEFSRSAQSAPKPAMTQPANPPSPKRARMAALRKRWPKGRTGVLLAICSLPAVVLLTSLAFYTQTTISHQGRARSGISVDSKSFSGLSRSAVVAKLETMESKFGETKIKVHVINEGAPGTEDFVTDAQTIGLHIDIPTMTERIMSSGRQGSWPTQFFNWISRKFGVDTIAMATTVDRKVARTAISSWAAESTNPPVEASIVIGKSTKTFIGISGRAGEGIDTEAFLRDLPVAAAKGLHPISVNARHGTVEPRFSREEASELATQAEAIVKTPLALSAGGRTAQLSSAQLRSFISSVPGATRLELSVDGEAAAKAAEMALVQAGTAATEPKFSVNSSGGIDITPGKSGLLCCGEDAPTRLNAAILNRPPGAVEMELVESQPGLSLEAAHALGITTQVGSFTTRHPAGQPRVTNIHLIADKVRGQVIMPGKSLSINALIGPRTLEKGFVVDHVIEDGIFAESVGGGISQFATTLFNAAWFAGMEFGEYQSHSLYIPRYPYGREATLNFPHPDLKIKNPSPYGLLIWPTYTSTSITVNMYSTKWVSVTALEQTKTPDGSCTKVTAHRKRVFLDGRTDTDATIARYRENEGQNCDQAEPPETTTSSTSPKPGSTTTTSPKPTTTTTTTRPPTTTTTRP